MKKLLSTLDRFLARNVFGPTILAACRATRHSPNEMAGALLILACFAVAWVNLRPPLDAMDQIVVMLSLIAVPAIYVSIFVMKSRYETSNLWRILFGVCFLLTLPKSEPLTVVFTLLLVAAEYAALIGNPATLPDDAGARG